MEATAEAVKDDAVAVMAAVAPLVDALVRLPLTGLSAVHSSSGSSQWRRKPLG